MTALRLPICIAVLMVMVIPGGSAHQEQAPPRAGTVVQGVRAVLVDVVVRDRKGQPVRDLTAADFEVLEDGVTQKVGSFTPFLSNAPATAAGPATGAPAGATGAAPNAAGGPDNGPIVTALVFDRLSPEAQRLAVQAAQGYLGNKEETASYIGIFGVDLALTPYAPFTRNAQILRQALNKMSSRPTTGYSSTERQQRNASVGRPASMTPNPSPPRRQQGQTPPPVATALALKRSWRKCSRAWSQASTPWSAISRAIRRRTGSSP